MTSARAPSWTVHLPAGVAPESVDLLAGTSLPGAWVRHWEAAPAKPLVHDTEHGWLTAGAFEERTRLVAGRYAQAGLQRGDRLLMSAAPSTDLVVAYVAAVRMGLTVVPLNSSYVEREVAHIVGDARPAGGVIEDVECRGWVRRGAPGPMVLVGPDVDLGGGPEPSLDDVAADDPALIAYTSGTTGAPKGAVLSHANLLAGAHALRLAWRWSPVDRLVLALPLFHMHGLGVGLHGTLTSGAEVVLRPAFDVDDVCDAVSGHHASLFFGVPTMYARLAASPRLADLSALRLAVSGSAPLPAELWDVVAERCGQRILERYGMTETVMNVSNPYDGERRPGTVGFPLPGVEVRLRPLDAEIQVRGPNVFSGYWNRPDANRDAFDDDGWFSTGDIGSLDPDGYLRIVGRLKDLIISGGYNVYPREVEEVLRRHPSVAEVAVVGTPSPRWGEEVTAFVVAADVVDADDLLRFAATQLAPFKRPKSVRFVDGLPRNALGKVLKHELR